MGVVRMHNVVSVDGFVADVDDQVGPLFDWYSNGDIALDDRGLAMVSTYRPTTSAPSGPRSARWSSGGTCMTNGWEGTLPAGEHLVVSHRPKPDGWLPGAPYHFVDDVARAIALAKELAGDRDVAVAAGDVDGQAFALGLVDDVAMDVVPVVFGSGKRYFGSGDAQHLLEDPHVVIQSDRVLHLQHRVRRTMS